MLICPNCGFESNKTLPSGDQSKAVRCPSCKLSSAGELWGASADSPTAKTPKKGNTSKASSPRKNAGAFDDLLARFVGAALTWAGLISVGLCLLGAAMEAGSQQDHVVQSGVNLRIVFYLIGATQGCLLAGAGIVVERVRRISIKIVGP